VIAQKKKETILENFRKINNNVVEMKDDSFLKEALDLIIGLSITRYLINMY